MPFYCKRCASTFREIDIDAPNCGNCGYPVSGEAGALDLEGVVRLIEEIMTGPDFDGAKFDRYSRDKYIRLKKSLQAYKEYEIVEVAEYTALTCPKCGGTQIRAFAQKWKNWPILRLFFKNKANWICVECNARFRRP